MILRAFAAILAALMLTVGGGAVAGPDASRLLLYRLLDLDQRELFASGEHNPLAEMQAWSDLYVTLRGKAKTDATPDRRHLKSFLLMGWIARAKNDFAIIESFNTDFMALFEARPDDTLKVIAAEDFLLPEMCAYLAKYFFFEDRDPERRGPWVEQFRSHLTATLGSERAQQCLAAFWRVKS